VARIFLAVPVPPAIKAALLKVRQANEMIPRIVWMREHNLHLTVYFMGHAPRHKVNEIIEHILPVVEARPKFELEFESICLAPSRKPRMIWARWQRSPLFTEFARSVYSSVKKLSPDFTFEFEDPVPHITLARFNSTVDTSPIVFPETGLKKFEVTECELFESVHAPEGVKYECVRHFELP
jgi:RNA 2',3'-cyclic 3'-phosphodiesterase